jgi:malate synthase
MVMNERIKLLEQAIKEWNSLADTPIGTDIHRKQIRAFILGKGSKCEVEDVLGFIHNEMMD